MWRTGSRAGSEGSGRGGARRWAVVGRQGDHGQTRPSGSFCREVGVRGQALNGAPGGPAGGAGGAPWPPLGFPQTGAHWAQSLRVPGWRDRGGSGTRPAGVPRLGAAPCGRPGTWSANWPRAGLPRGRPAPGPQLLSWRPGCGPEGGLRHPHLNSLQSTSPSLSVRSWWSTPQRPSTTCPTTGWRAPGFGAGGCTWPRVRLGGRLGSAGRRRAWLLAALMACVFSGF